MKVKNYGKATSNPDGLQDGEMVECILLDMDYNSQHKKEIDEYNVREAKIAEALDEVFTPKTYSYKVGGVTWNAAVVKRKLVADEIGDYIGEPVWKVEGDELKSPSYVAKFNIQMFPPTKLLDMKSKNGYSIGDMFQLGGDVTIAKHGGPKISKLLPSVRPAKDYDSNKSADEVKDSELEKYSALIVQDNSRKRAWKEIISEFENATEDEALEWMNELISRRLLLNTIEGRTVIYLPIMVGMRFRGVVSNPSGGFYFNVNTIEKWDQNRRCYPIYNSMTTTFPTDKDNQLVSLITNAIQKVKDERDTISQHEGEDDTTETAGVDEEW